MVQPGGDGITAGGPVSTAHEEAVAEPPPGSGTQEQGPPGRDLEGDERRTIALLSLPTLGFALSTTVVTTYLPVVVSGFVGSTAVIGALIAVEGLLALALPPLVGARSDHLRTRFGGRLPFLMAGTPLLALALVAMAFVGAFGFALLAVAAFFAAYYLAYEPYRALYPDLVAEEAVGRAQSTQAIARGVGTGVALVSGGLLLSLGQAAPFAGGAIIVIATNALFLHTLLRRLGVPRQQRAREAGRARDAFAELWRVARTQPPLRRYLVANGLWEAGLGAIKTFVILWITLGLGLSLSEASGVLAAAAVCVLGGAAVAGKLADRFGRARVMQFASVGFGAPMVVPFLSQEGALIVPLLPVIGVCGGIVMALPYALLVPMMPPSQHGLLSGFYSLTRGVGLMIGPLVAGVAIEIMRALDAPLGTQGFSAMWLVAGSLILATVPLSRRLRDTEPAAG